MCKDCIAELYPDRGRTCNENGCYMINYKGCKQCGKFAQLVEKDRETEEEDDGMKEEITFLHACPDCNHTIGKHEYTFEVDKKSKRQEYSMKCPLCGCAEDSASINPLDKTKITSELS